MSEVDPFTIHDGLAIYQLGDGDPVLLPPYPHASTLYPMAEGPLAALLADLGRRVITFDPPGAYRSVRPMRCDMAEMLACMQEALAVCGVVCPVDLIGHSMGGLCALGFAIAHPEQVKRLILVGACSGFPAVLRWSMPHNWRWYRDSEWWHCLWLGTRKMVGLDNLAVHKRLDNLVASASYVDKRHVEDWRIEPGDAGRPAPPRALWLRTVRSVDYRARLGEVRAPTLVCVGRHDPQTPVPCSEELQASIANADLAIFEQSGHSPFVEEAERFRSLVVDYLATAEPECETDEMGGPYD